MNDIESVDLADPGMRPEWASELNDKQFAFVMTFLTWRHYGMAAKAYGVDSESANALSQRGRYIASHAKVKKAIVDGMQHAASSATVSPAMVMEHLCRMLFVRKSDLYGDDGQLLPINEIDDETAAAIQSFEIEEYVEKDKNNEVIGRRRVKKIRLADKGKIADLLNKMMGAYVTRVEHSGPNGKPIDFKTGLTPQFADELRKTLLGLHARNKSDE